MPTYPVKIKDGREKNSLHDNERILISGKKTIQIGIKIGWQGVAGTDLWSTQTI